MLLRCNFQNILLLKNIRGCVTFLNFLLNITSWACLLWSGLNVIFHLKAQSVVCNFRLLGHFGAKKSEKKNWQKSQRFWTISNLHGQCFVVKWLDIPIIYISYKKNKYIFIEEFWQILSGVVRTFWAQKIRQVKSTKFTRTFELFEHEWFSVLKCQDIPKLYIAYNSKQQILRPKIYELSVLFLFSHLLTCKNSTIF